MDFISSPAGGPRGALGLCGFLPTPVRDAGTAGTAHTHGLRSPLLSSCCFSGCGRPYVALCSSSFAPRALRSSQLVRQRRFTTPVAVATSWRRSQMKNKFPASVSYMLSLNQIQRKRESHEHQSAVLAARVSMPQRARAPDRRRVSSSGGPPSASGKQGARGPLPKAVELSEHRSPHSSEGLLSLVPAQELPTYLL